MNILNNYDLRSVKNKNANIYTYSNVVMKFISTDSLIFASNVSSIFNSEYLHEVEMMLYCWSPNDQVKAHFVIQIARRKDQTFF